MCGGRGEAGHLRHIAHRVRRVQLVVHELEELVAELGVLEVPRSRDQRRVQHSHICWLAEVDDGDASRGAVGDEDAAAPTAATGRSNSDLGLRIRESTRIGGCDNELVTRNLKGGKGVTTVVTI